MKTGYERLDQRPYDSHYLCVDTLIDHPVREVWPYALDIGGWMSDHRLETLSGEPGSAGHFQRVLPRGLSADTPTPHYHLYGVAAIVPLKCIALEVFPERGGSYGDASEKTSFDLILLADAGGKTQLTFLAIDVDFAKIPGGNRRQKRQEKELRMTERLNQYFDNLKRRIISRAPLAAPRSPLPTPS